MRRFVVLLILSVGLTRLSAQTDFEAYKRQQQQQFDRDKAQKKQDFEAYRDQLNAQFADVMRKAWKSFPVSASKPQPKRPEPPRPVVRGEGDESVPATLPVKVVVPADKPSAHPTPVVPIPEAVPPTASTPGHAFLFYGTRCKVPLAASQRFTLSGTQEAHVADAWEVMSSESYLQLLSFCSEYRRMLGLCDWGYVRFIQEMSSSYFGSSRPNEAIVMQMYLLTQSGYKVRIARTGSHLVLLIPFEQEVYGYPYITIQGEPYYIVSNHPKGASFVVLDHAFAKEKRMSLRMDRLPALAVKSASVRSLADDGEVKASVEFNQNLIDFLDDYPASSAWDLYSLSSISKGVKEKLYPSLQSAIAGKSEVEAADVLLRFVQTALDYKTDHDQFGVERALFADETLYYPYCDCEDRAILYSILVRDLMGLDVVLLAYPNHLATAVGFRTEVEGDCILLGGKRYVVCDPTYIGATVGEAMPQCERQSAAVLRIAK